MHQRNHTVEKSQTNALIVHQRIEKLAIRLFHLKTDWSLAQSHQIWRRKENSTSQGNLKFPGEKMQSCQIWDWFALRAFLKFWGTILLVSFCMHGMSVKIIIRSTLCPSLGKGCCGENHSFQARTWVDQGSLPKSENLLDWKFWTRTFLVCTWVVPLPLWKRNIKCKDSFQFNHLQGFRAQRKFKNTNCNDSQFAFESKARTFLFCSGCWALCLSWWSRSFFWLCPLLFHSLPLSHCCPILYPTHCPQFNQPFPDLWTHAEY